MKNFKFLLIAIVTVMISSCAGEQSLQEYYVEKQNNEDFLALDLPTSMFANAENLDEKQKATLESIRKINILAIQNKPENMEKIESEKNSVAKILEDEKYQLLMKYGGGDRQAQVYFTGDEDAIDELIVYGFDEERGMGIARVLGKDMNPGEIMKLMSSLNQDDFNSDGLKQLSGFMNPSASK